MDNLNLLEDDKPVPKAPPRRKEREERPKNNIKEDLGYRISGLEKAKTEPGMSPYDIAALERVIVKLKEKQAAQNEPKREEKED